MSNIKRFATHQRPSYDGAIAPRGIECTFEYNGLVLNDLRDLDTYRVTRATGLDDADLRDTREPNPDRDGETPTSSLYGGRTIALTGRIEAGNLPQLRKMWGDLKAAFDDVSTEREMILRWNDSFVDFAAPPAAMPTLDNLVLNPNGYDNLTGWNPNLATLSSVVIGSGKGIRATSTTTASDVGPYYYLPTTLMRVEPGATYAASGRYAASSHGHPARVLLIFRTAGDTDALVVNGTTVSPGNVTSVVGVAPANARYAYLAFYTTVASVVGATYDWQNAMLAKVPDGTIIAPAYNDGWSARSRWSGAPENSGSQQYGGELESDIVVTEGDIAFSGEGLVAHVTPPNAIRFHSTRRKLVDSRTVMHVKASATSGFLDMYASARVQDSTTHIFGGCANNSVVIWKRDNDIHTSLASFVGPALVGGADYWIVLTVRGNTIHVERWRTDPDLGGSPEADVWHTLTGSDLGILGEGVAGYNGVGWWYTTSAAHLDTRVYSVDIRGLDPGDLVVPSCKKAGKIEGDEQLIGFQYRKPFMLTLRSSSPLLLSRESSSVRAQVPSATLTFPLGGGGIPFPPSGAIAFGGDLATISNLGYAPSHPVVRFYGPLESPALFNETDGTNIALAGSLLAGDVIEVDCENRTVVDSFGTNQYNLLAPDTTWLSLDPGDNELVAGHDGPAGAGEIEVVWRHAFR